MISKDKRSLSSRTFNAGLWQFTSLGSVAILQIATNAYLARLVLPSEYGLMAVANIVIVFAYMFSEIGLGPAIIHNKSLTQRHINAGFTLSLIFGSLLMLLVMVSGDLTADIFKTERLAKIIPFVGFIFFFMALSITPQSLLEKRLEFRRLFICNIVSYIIGNIPVALYLAVNGFGVWSLVYSTLFQNILKCAMLFYFSNAKYFLQGFTSEMKELLFYGGGLTFLRIFNNVAIQAPSVIVGRVLGIEQLGIFERSAMITSLPGRYVGDTIDKVLFPAMSLLNQDKDKLRKAFMKAFVAMNIVMWPVAIIGILFAEQIVFLFLGERWSEAVFPMQLLFCSIPFFSSVRIVDSLVRATGSIYESTKRKMFYALFVILFGLSGYYFGLPGVIIGFFLANVGNYILMALLSSSILELQHSFFWKTIITGMRLSIIILIAISISHMLMFGLEIGSLVKAGIDIAMIFGVMIFLLIFFPKYLLGHDYDIIAPEIKIIFAKIGVSDV